MIISHYSKSFRKIFKNRNDSHNSLVTAEDVNLAYDYSSLSFVYIQLDGFWVCPIQFELTFQLLFHEKESKCFIKLHALLK